MVYFMYHTWMLWENGLSFMAYFSGGDPNHLRVRPGMILRSKNGAVQLHQVQGHVSVEDTDCLGNRTLGPRGILKKKPEQNVKG